MPSASQTSTMTVNSSKKRKRDGASAGDAKTKKKKVSIKEPSEQSGAKTAKTAKTIQVTGIMQPQFSAPVIATTPGLVVPDAIEFDSFARAGKPGKQAKSSSKRSRPAAPSAELLLHSSGHHTVDYTGKEDKAPGTGAALRHYIGVLDPATGKLQVVEAKKMVIRGSVRAREASEDAMRGVSVKNTMMDLRNDLGQTFGTKKAKKAIQALTENAISTRKRKEDGTFDAVAMSTADRAQLQSMRAATAGMSTRDELRETVDRAKPIPQGNFEAREIQDVYVASEMVGADTLATVPVRDWQESVRAGEDIQLYSRFVAQRVNQVAARAAGNSGVADGANGANGANGSDGSDGLEQLRLLRYLYWVILYWQAAKPGRERGTRRQPPREKLREMMDGAPEAIIEHIRQRFSDSGTIRKFQADLLMTHCCAFACIIDGFEVNTYDLREDLKLEQQQISQYFSEIGARNKVVKTDDAVSHVAKLALPLQFPNSMRMRRRR